MSPWTKIGASLSPNCRRIAVYLMATVAALARTNLAYMTIFALTHVWSQFGLPDALPWYRIPPLRWVGVHKFQWLSRHGNTWPTCSHAESEHDQRGRIHCRGYSTRIWGRHRRQLPQAMACVSLDH